MYPEYSFIVVVVEWGKEVFSDKEDRYYQKYRDAIYSMSILISIGQLPLY